MFSSFISGFICGGFVAIIAAVYYCTEKPTREPPPIIDRDVLAQQIMDNLAKVQAFQRRIGNLPVPYMLCKQMVAAEEQLNICWIPVPADDIKAIDNQTKEDEAWERLKVSLNLAWLDDDDMSEDYAD